MRPRVETRGNVFRAAAKRYLPDGFNEAACRDTRKYIDKRFDGIEIRLASMRPRVETRGNIDRIKGAPIPIRLQ